MDAPTLIVEWDLKVDRGKDAWPKQEYAMGYIGWHWDSFNGKFDVFVWDKLYEDTWKFRNGRKMLDLVDKVVYFVPISNGEEGEWFEQCDDTWKVINAKGLGKNRKIC